MSAAVIPVRVPQWALFIRGKNVTGDLRRDFVSITFTDQLHGESDTLAVTLENSALKWLDSWWPTKGDPLDLHLGYAGEPLVRVGTFELDEPTFSGPPDVVTLNAIAAPVTPALRTQRTVGYERQSLRQVAEQIAGRHGLSVTGVIKPITVDRVTQANERDLEFLKRLGDRHGYVVTVRGKDLVFTERETLQSAGPIVRTIARADCGAGYDLAAKATRTYKGCLVTYHDPATGKTIEGKAGAIGEIGSTDTLRIIKRVESVADAERLARSKLATANLGERSGSVSVEGDPKLLAGVRVTLKDFGRMDGTWQVKQAEHALSRSPGYTTRCEVARV